MSKTNPKPNRLTLTETATATQLNLTASDDKGRRRFEMAAYTGAPVKTMFGGVVIDIDGMDFAGKRKPILREHDRTRIAGYADEITVEDGKVMMRGFLSKTTADGKEIAELADEGFPWQASVGIDIDDIEGVNAKDTVTVNGIEFTGPGMVIRKSTLKESSFVPLGADANTSAAVFSDGDSLSQLLQETFNMADKAKTETAQADANAIADAENSGFKRGYDQAKIELSELVKAFPGRLEFALAQFTAGANLTAAKAALSDVLAAELADASKKLDEATKTAAAAQAKAIDAASGQAAVALAAPVAVKNDDKPDGSDPAALAKWEWEHDKPAGFTSEKNYINVRVAELTGKLNTITGVRK